MSYGIGALLLYHYALVWAHMYTTAYTEGVDSALPVVAGGMYIPSGNNGSSNLSTPEVEQ